MRRRSSLLLVPLLLLLVAPWGAAGQTTTPTKIDGNPLTVFTNPSGKLQARFMGGVNQDVGAVGGLVEETPWDAFESNQLGMVRTGVADSTGPGLDDSISQPPPVDNAAAVQWNTFYPPNALAAGASAQFNVAWRFIDTLGLSPLTATEQTGNEHVITAQVGDLNGAPQAGQ